MKIDPLEAGTRRSQIVQRLTEYIVGGSFPVGSRLTEVELSRQLGVSRAPLREAIRELVDTGLLVSIPYRGLFVRDFTIEDLDELYSLRTALEQLAFRRCWDKRTAAACSDLQNRNAKLKRAVEKGASPVRTIELELRLHDWAYELAGHKLLQEAWDRLKPNLQFYFTLHQKAHQRGGPLIDAHEKYVNYACGTDLDAMLRHLEQHMQQGYERVAKFIAKGNEDLVKRANLSR